MFICTNLIIEAKRSKLMLNSESSEAKRICSIVEKIISKRSVHVYIEEFKYRSEANRFDSDFVFQKTKKSELSFFLKTKSKKRKGSIVNYRSFAIASDADVKQQPEYLQPRLMMSRLIMFPQCSAPVCSCIT